MTSVDKTTKTIETLKDLNLYKFSFKEAENTKGLKGDKTSSNVRSKKGASAISSSAFSTGTQLIKVKKERVVGGESKVIKTEKTIGEKSVSSSAKNSSKFKRLFVKKKVK